jgi:hypothetical protein
MVVLKTLGKSRTSWPGAADDHCAKQNSSKQYSGVNLSVFGVFNRYQKANSPSPRTLSSDSRPQEIHMTINRLAILTRRRSACAQAILVASALYPLVNSRAGANSAGASV